MENGGFELGGNTAASENQKLHKTSICGMGFFDDWASFCREQNRMYRKI